MPRRPLPYAQATRTMRAPSLIATHRNECIMPARGFLARRGFVFRCIKVSSVAAAGSPYTCRTIPRHDRRGRHDHAMRPVPIPHPARTAQPSYTAKRRRCRPCATGQHPLRPFAAGCPRGHGRVRMQRVRAWQPDGRSLCRGRCSAGCPDGRMACRSSGTGAKTSYRTTPRHMHGGTGGTSG